jgi:hypothetical protein
MEAPYRSEPDEEAPRELSFADLSPETRRYLTDSCAGEGAVLLRCDPLPLVGSPRTWLALAALSGMALVLLLLRGFGDIRGGPRGVSHGETTLVAAALGGLLLGAGLGWRARRLRQPGAPEPGVYLFARELIDARGPRLRVLSTTKIEQIRRQAGELVCLFSGGERYRFPGGKSSAAYLQGEIRSLREVLEQAESAEDRARMARLDPLVHERARWHEFPAASRRGIREPTRRPVLLVAPPLLLGVLASWPLCLWVAEESDLVGVHEAAARQDLERLARYRDHAFARYPARSAAEEAMLRLARRSPRTDGYVAYLRGDGAQAAVASEELFQRLRQNEDDTELWLQFLRVGREPRRQQVEDILFERAKTRESLWLLEQLAAVGSRKEEISRKILPRRRIAQAFVEKDAAALRWFAKSAEDEEVRREARETLASLYRPVRERLVAVTGLRTPLARALHGALEKAEQSGSSLIAQEEGGALGLLPLFRRVVGLYVDAKLLPVVDASEVRPSGATVRMVPKTRVLSGVPAGLEVRIDFSCSWSGEEASAKVREELQTVRFRAPLPGKPENGRTFEQLVQTSLVDALLGERKIR